MSVTCADYSDPKLAIQWFDIDPSFDPNWTSWVSLRVYAFIPGLGRMLDNLVPYYPSKFSEVANVCIDSGGPLGIIKQERLTADQVKAALGVKGKGGSVGARPIRVDKALLTIFAINSELSRKNYPIIRPKIYLSAFNVSGLSAAFQKLSSSEKETTRKNLTAALEQPENLVIDLLKGSKVSMDMAIKTHSHVITLPEFKGSIPLKIEDAIETPSEKHKPASGFEDFSIGRLADLPPPFSRPILK